MTTHDLYTHYAAYCDLMRHSGWHCLLSTREEIPGALLPCDLHAGIPLPTEYRPAQWLHIVDVGQFVSLHLTRLADGSPILQRLAARNLIALQKSLSS